MDVAGVTASMADTITSATKLLAHTNSLATIREKTVTTSCEEYLMCKFLLLANGGDKNHCRTTWRTDT